MRASWFAVLALGALLPGCQHPPTVPHGADPTYSQYHAPGFNWNAVARVVLVPLVNETVYPQAAEEMRNALAAEFQQCGQFEIVVPPPDDHAHLSQQIRAGGEFNEGLLVELARCFRADVVVLGALTQYHPYTRPRLGLTLQAVSPDAGRVIASVDGLWDSTLHPIADQAREFYKRQRSCGQQVVDCLLGRTDSAYAADLVLDSPALYQRFVAHEAVRTLVTVPAPAPPPAPSPTPSGPPPPPSRAPSPK